MGTDQYDQNFNLWAAYVSAEVDLCNCWTLYSSAGFAERKVAMLSIANLANSGQAILIDISYFAARQSHLRVGAFFGQQLRRRSGRTHQLPPLAGLQLNIVQLCT